jgi:hypothetical protein
MMIRPALTFANTIWYFGVVYKVRITELSWLQRLASLTITWAISMVQTVAMEVFLGLLPLSVITEAEDQAGICRLMCSQQWKPKFTNFRQTRKCWGMEHELILQMETERMIPQAICSQVA